MINKQRLEGESRFEYILECSLGGDGANVRVGFRKVNRFMPPKVLYKEKFIYAPTITTKKAKEV